LWKQRLDLKFKIGNKGMAGHGNGAEAENFKPAKAPSRPGRLETPTPPQKPLFPWKHSGLTA
jgi:hypothetical protein